MTISGFTMVKNAGKLYYPFKESILSILPIVDEFVIALGDCDDDDNTLDIINSICSPKIRIVNTVWDTSLYPGGSELAHQTDIAKENCKGDWLFYLQADEVVHENNHKDIIDCCLKYINDFEVDGIVFKYLHFWGDYNHAFEFNHSWYRHEIRIIRNISCVHSWRDAQSFRKISDFSKEKYLKKEGTIKLNVVKTKACIYHYGSVRPPLLMACKQQRLDSCYRGEQLTSDKVDLSKVLDYGLMKNVPDFKREHPMVMIERISEFNWSSQLNFSSTRKEGLKILKHEKFKYRMLTFIESLFFKEDGIFTFKNYKLIRK